MGLPHALREAVMASDVDARKELLNNVVMVGAGSLFPGLAERITAEMGSLVSSVRVPPYPPIHPSSLSPLPVLRTHGPLLTQSAKIRVVTPASTERRFANWIGCSILASLGSFQQLWISKAEYDERGPEVVSRRCG